MTLIHDPAPTTPITPMTEPLSADHDMGTPPATSDAVVDLEIDGQQVSVPAGPSSMRAAALAGVDVPKLCATDSVKAFGSCRVCLVEIEGRPGAPASCTTPVAAGMKVATTSPKVALAKLVRSIFTNASVCGSSGAECGFPVPRNT